MSPLLVINLDHRYGDTTLYTDDELIKLFAYIDQCPFNLEYSVTDAHKLSNSVREQLSKESDSQMNLNGYKHAIFDNAEKKGFHERTNFAEKCMLVCCEMAEAVEADRDGCYMTDKQHYPFHNTDWMEWFKTTIRGTVEEEIVDAMIRLFDIAGILDIDLDWLVRAKMRYNSERAYLHGRMYG